VAIVAGVVLVVVNLLVFLNSQVQTNDVPTGAPVAVQEVLPTPGSIVRQQEDLVADLRDDLFGVLVVDGREIPEDQLQRVVPLGRVAFRPGAGKEFERWEPGIHQAQVFYWSQTEARPAKPASYAWTFRSG
jgi:hypothetical protein